MKSALVFTRTKHRANRLADWLVRQGVRAARIHGNRSQSQRTQALEGFKAGRYDVLVATDIAARGIDVVALGHVVNFDVPRGERGLHPPRRPHRPGRGHRRGVHVRGPGGRGGPPRDRAGRRQAPAAGPAARLRLPAAAARGAARGPARTAEAALPPSPASDDGSPPLRPVARAERAGRARGPGACRPRRGTGGGPPAASARAGGGRAAPATAATRGRGPGGARPRAIVRPR